MSNAERAYIRKVIARLTRDQRARYERLIAYRDEYRGQSGVERGSRERAVTAFLARVG